MTRKKISPTIEDYLGILYVLERDGEPIVGVHLAEILGVTPPTVTNTLKRMMRDTLIIEDSHGMHLSGKGLAVARSVMRRHMLSEWMLTHILSWSQVHEEAHELEHAISERVEAALINELDQPIVCPHGNPLPGYEEKTAHWIALTNTTPRENVIIRRVHELAEEKPDLLLFLEENHILPGNEAYIESILPFNQTITIQIYHHSVTLGFPTAKYIFVEKVNPKLSD